MTHSHTILDQEDVLTELLDVCKLRLLNFTSIERKGSPSKGFLLKTQRKGSSMRIEFQSIQVHIIWSVEYADLHPFFSNLPSSQRWNEEGATTPFFELFLNEIETHRPGRKFILNHLSTAFFVYIIRDFSQSLPNYRSPLKSPPIARAIQLMHANPEQDWKVPHLARRVGESKSSFNRKFIAAVGIAPYQYLRNWRIILAKKRLHDERINLEQLAFELGFSSQSSLSRAFKEVVGVSPSQWLAKSHLS